MWITFALASAFFAGLVAILAKIGIRSTPSNLATGIRTLVVLVLAWAMVWITGALESLASVSMNTLVLLTLSGLATGASWLFFFRALQVGPVNPVVAVDKSSIVLTIFAGIIVFGETENLNIRLFGIVAIGVGTVCANDQVINAIPINIPGTAHRNTGQVNCRRPINAKAVDAGEGGEIEGTTNPPTLPKTT